MTTYIEDSALIDTITRLKYFSEAFNVKVALCDRPWVLFNARGNKVVHIFYPNGNVLITVNGRGGTSTWKWIESNQTLAISQPDSSIIMLHPVYYNRTILALHLDGTQEYAFMFDENETQNPTPQSLTELHNLLQLRLGKEEEKKRKFEELFKDIAPEKRKKAERKYQAKMNRKVQKMFVLKSPGWWLYELAVIVVFSVDFLIALFAINWPNTFIGFLLFLLFIILLFGLSGCLLSYLFTIAILRPYIMPKAKKFIKENPDDELVPYIIDFFDKWQKKLLVYHSPSHRYL